MPEMQDPKPGEAVGVDQLPIEMLQEVCRCWRDLVDGWDLWRSILPWKHPDLWPVIRICLPPADDPGPCILGCFCERRPLGHNLLRNPRGLAATKPGEETMCTSASRTWPVGVCALKPEPKEAPGPNQLPIEMLREVLSYLPPRMLLRHCRQVCRRWRDLVDGWDLWRSILPWKHPDLWPVIRTCLPPADDPGPCILGRFCERRPVGRNLLRNPRGLGGFRKWTVLSREDDWTEEKENLEVMPRAYMQTSFLSSYRRYHKRQVLDLEKEGLWRELLDSGNIEICVSDWRNDRQGIDCIYQLTVHLLDASQAILDHFSPLPFPIRRGRNSVSSRASHVFSSIKKGVRFVSFERHIWDLEFRNEQYGVSLMNSSVIVRVCLP
ncbi:F-box only protein 27-like [Moschus berezovskii]|uniref:F-box only protein 27-like n=1 Tax=Moschus berezovskii TaxID=68408 RepID=UPI002445079A|nr:F-box only protein 27-like [Moschus berezovskii]